MPELEYVTLSSGSRLQQPQVSATASNSNSATSIQAALRAGNAAATASGSVVSMDQRGDALAAISLGSGSAASGSIPYAEDPILGAIGSPRPTSPDMLAGPNATVGQSQPVGGATSTVKSLRSWFLPTAKPQTSTGAGNFGMSGYGSGSTNNNTTTTTTTTASNSSNNLNTNNTTATTTTTTTGTNNLTTNITKNSPISEDTSNQGSFSLILIGFSFYLLFLGYHILWLMFLLCICNVYQSIYYVFVYIYVRVYLQSKF